MMRQGYVALITVIIVSVVVITLGVALSMTSISEGQMSLSGTLDGKSMNLLESCTEEALLRLNEDGDIPTTISLPTGSCTIAINDHEGENWTFTVTASINDYENTVLVTAVHSDRVYMTSWQEL